MTSRAQRGLIVARGRAGEASSAPTRAERAGRHRGAERHRDEQPAGSPPTAGFPKGNGKRARHALTRTDGLARRPLIQRPGGPAADRETGAALMAAEFPAFVGKPSRWSSPAGRPEWPARIAATIRKPGDRSRTSAMSIRAFMRSHGGSSVSPRPAGAEISAAAFEAGAWLSAPLRALLRLCPRTNDNPTAATITSAATGRPSRRGLRCRGPDHRG